jgi:hypothetical protein
MFSSIIQRQRALVQHRKFGEMIPVLDYYQDEQIFLLDPATLGFMIVCQPLNGVSAAMKNLLGSLFTYNYPDDTTMVLITDLYEGGNEKEMRKRMAEIVASLPRNPLPDAFIVEPTNTAPEALEVVRKEIAGWPRVDHVQLDSAWIKRFDAFLRLGRLAVTSLPRSLPLAWWQSPSTPSACKSSPRPRKSKWRA